MFVMVVALIVGLITGYVSSMYFSEIKVNELMLRETPVVLCTLFVFAEIMLLVVILVRYFQGKKYFGLVTDEDEIHYKLADKKLSAVLTLTSIGIFVGMVSVSLMIPVMSSWKFQWGNGNYNVISLLPIACIVIYFIFLICTVMLQAKTVQMLKKIYPEKNGDFFEKKFQKVWLESCDENERRKIGEASLYSYIVTQKTISIVLALSILLNIAFPNAYLISFTVGIIGIISTVSYAKKIAELDEKESKKHENNIKGR